MLVVICSAILLSFVRAQSNLGCGTSLAPLVIGGRPVTAGEYPWLVALYQQNKAGRWAQFCGGSLLSPRMVITAAHCLVFEGDVMKPEDLRVGLGKLHRDFYEDEDYAVIASVTQIIPHQRFLGAISNFALDVGLLKLNIPVQMSVNVLPACIDLNTMTIVSNGARVHAAGWGTSENGTSTERAQAATLSYLDNHTCLRQVREAYRRYITHEKICTRSINGSQVDRGDSGGALTYLKNGRHYVIGIVSTKIIDETAFSIFTDLSNPEIHYWVKQQTESLDLAGLMLVNRKTKKYVLRTNGVNWFRAAQLCAAEGKKLATIMSEEEDNNLISTLNSSVSVPRFMWISATDFGEEGKFTWMSTGEPLTYTRWNKGIDSDGKAFSEPSLTEGKEHCVYIHGQQLNFNWNDDKCHYQLAYICEYF